MLTWFLILLGVGFGLWLLAQCAEEFEDDLPRLYLRISNWWHRHDQPGPVWLTVANAGEFMPGMCVEFERSLWVICERQGNMLRIEPVQGEG